MEKQFIGTITGTKGFDGRMSISGTPVNIESIAIGSVCFVGFSKQFTSEYKMRSWTKGKKEHIFSLECIDSKEVAIKLKEHALFTYPKDIIKSKDESFSVGNLLDCKVYNSLSGEFIGKMKDVFILPGNDVWIVETKKGELPIPFIDKVVKLVDLNNKRIEIEPLDGLEELIIKNKNE